MCRPHALHTYSGFIGIHWRLLCHDVALLSTEGQEDVQSMQQHRCLFYCHSSKAAMSNILWLWNQILCLDEQISDIFGLCSILYFIYPVFFSVMDIAHIPFLICQRHSFSHFLNIDFLMLQWLLFTSRLCMDKMCRIGRRSYWMGWAGMGWDGME